MTLRPVSQAELERQRTAIEADFRGGWIPADAGQPRTLTAAARAGESSFSASEAGQGRVLIMRITRLSVTVPSLEIRCRHGSAGRSSRVWATTPK